MNAITILRIFFTVYLLALGFYLVVYESDKFRKNGMKQPLWRHLVGLFFTMYGGIMSSIIFDKFWR